LAQQLTLFLFGSRPTLERFVVAWLQVARGWGLTMVTTKYTA